MQYRNTRTGSVINAACPILGGDWEPLCDDSAPSKPDNLPKTAPKPRKTGKKASS